MGKKNVKKYMYINMYVSVFHVYNLITYKEKWNYETGKELNHLESTILNEAIHLKTTNSMFSPIFVS